MRKSVLVLSMTSAGSMIAVSVPGSQRRHPLLQYHRH